MKHLHRLLIMILLASGPGFAQSTLAEIPTPPTNPPAGQQYVYIKNGSSLCTKDSAGVEYCTSAVVTTGVFTNQTNTYTTGNQDLTNATDLIVPASSGASGVNVHDINFDTLMSNYHGNNGAPMTFAGFPDSLNPGNGDCVIFVNSAGHISLGDSGSVNCPGSSLGTVTNVSMNPLSPLYTCSVATSTTTPVITCTMVNAAQNSVLVGPASGGAGPWSFQTAPTISAANMTNFPTLNQNTTGTAAKATALATAPNVCTSPQFSLGVIASGNSVCSPLPATISSNTTGNAATATSLQTVPTTCASGTVSTGVGANGNAICTPLPGTQTRGHGTFALNVASIAPGACEATVTTPVSGALTSDHLTLDSNGVNLFTIPGYNPSSSTGHVELSKWLSPGNVNVQVCNSAQNTSTITPGAATLNYQVTYP